MNYIAFPLVSFLLALSLGGCGRPTGPEAALFGEWRLAPGADCPIDHLSFTPNSSTAHVIAIGPNAASQTTSATSYRWEDPNKAIVQGEGTGAGAMIYVMADHDHITSGDNQGCTYVRER